MKNKRKFGSMGEQLAVDFLKKEGYKICEVNWYCGHKEIDIIAETKEYLVIIEVKTRTSNPVSDITDLISKKKINLLIDAANSYIEMKEIDLETRFDLIYIEIADKEYSLEHYMDAFGLSF
ncbi:MAG: YraN family protein [Bacteroidales bacterium]